MPPAAALWRATRVEAAITHPAVIESEISGLGCVPPALTVWPALAAVPSGRTCRESAERPNTRRERITIVFDRRRQRMTSAGVFDREVELHALSLARLDMAQDG